MDKGEETLKHEVEKEVQEVEEKVKEVEEKLKDDKKAELTKVEETKNEEEKATDSQNIT